MPQMAPLYWLYMYIFFLFVLSLFFMLTFFIKPFDKMQSDHSSIKTYSKLWKL
uniref:ATP synthase complex subunit 8 n=1 Tax=Metopograpsus frontalis TaxID=1036996 RepID=A0A4D6IYE5_9EUCA|nr:ATP synthase F0 subunit 8 [Metopograpsus frontalis]QCC70812.1 ATP synthase F0 subunit 8 [Metopograpsus frontalis]